MAGRPSPDQEFASYVIGGLRSGFRVGFDHTHPLSPARRNMPSARAHAEVIDAYVQGEVTDGRVIGPLQKGDLPRLHTNRLGVVPKGHTPGKWRLITDLSFPPGGSVNDGICPAQCSLRYTTVEEVAGRTQTLGQGALLAKIDIKSAYRLVPVHPDDRHLLGFEWGGMYYVDAMLPFGLRSAPKIFTAVADALEWVIRSRGVDIIDHYLDDFIVMGPPSSPCCSQALETMLQTCADLGVPIAADKLEGPTSCLTFLGIEIDTRAGTLRLPSDKLDRILASLQEWCGRRVCRRRELESLIGTLHHACKVIRPGRAFLRRMIDLLRVAHCSHHHIRLNQQFQADVQWWQTFAVQWNGVAVLQALPARTIQLTTDASGQWGCGAWSGRNWFQYQWPANASHHHIAFKELFAILLACAVWGGRWCGVRVHGRCDNQAAVCALNRRSCRDPSLMHLLRCLFFLEAHFQFELVASHIPGCENTLADDLSRDLLPAFFSKAPHMDPSPSPLPPQLPALLLEPCSWTSPVWTRRFASTATAV